MRKCLLFAALLLVLRPDCSKAQSTFEAPDTVCVRQPVQLTSNTPEAASHYWGFCSGYLMNNPTGVNLGNNPYNPDGHSSDIEVVKEGDNYYGFLITSTNHSFTRLEYGNSLHNAPTATHYGNFNNALPEELNSLFVVYDTVKQNWHIFLSGGSTAANSAIARIDYGHSLSDTPNIVNFGNYASNLDAPHGIFIAKEADKWYGYVMNKSTTELLKMDMDTNISLTPRYTNLGPMPLTASPHDLVAVHDAGNWYFFVTNESNNSLSRIDVGPSLNLATMPVTTNLGDIDTKFFGPNGIMFVRDCDRIYFFVTNRTSHELVRVEMPAITGPYTATNFGNPAGFAAPANISHVIRDHDDVFAFVPNYADSTISRVLFAQCTHSSIPFSTTKRPPAYTYDTPGIYNLYYATNEGTPDMHVECKLITVLEIPPMEISNDTTICQGDTISLRVLSINALNLTWSPAYNLSSLSDVDVHAWPDYTTQYRILLPYANGCIVDTSIDVTVHKIKADAGPDRTLSDGASTLLGGPFTTTGNQYAYTWKPAQFISNSLIPNPSVNPPDDFTYYLEVRDTGGCADIDTVIIRVICGDLVLPNAFVPGGNPNASTTTFGLLNRGGEGGGSIIKLNYFRIFDRWGKEVFNTTDVTKRWDGKVEGDDAQMGVYVWEADGFCISGQRIHKSGNVTLIR